MTRRPRVPSFVRRGNELRPVERDQAGFPMVRSNMDPWQGDEPARRQRTSGYVAIVLPAEKKKTNLVRCDFGADVRAELLLQGSLADAVFIVQFGGDSAPHSVTLPPGSYELPGRVFVIDVDHALTVANAGYTARATIARM